MTARASGQGRRCLFDELIEAILLILLAYLPLALGGVFAISHLVIMGAAAAMAICFALRCLFARDLEVVWSWAYVPATLFLGWIAFQLLPLNLDRLASIAPGTAELWRELAGRMDGTSEGPETATASLYPWATRVQLRLLLSAGLILVVVSNVHRRPAAARRLVHGLSLIGLGVAVVALLQYLTESTAILWIYERGMPVTGGPFVHSGHFCQFMNLSMGAALGLLLLRASDRRPGEPLEVESLGGGMHTDRLLLAFFVLAIVTIALSQSRNGLMSMVLGAGVVTTVLHRSRFVVGIGWPVIGFLLLGFVGLLLLGFDPVYDRLAALGDPERGYGVRYELLRDTLAMFQHFPLLGSGHGSYEVVFPLFDQSMRSGTAVHAENLYVEILAETGWPGAVLAGAFGLLVVLAWKRVALAPSYASSSRPIALGLGFGLFTVAMHNITDFGLLLPALMTLGMVLAATLLGMGSSRASSATLARACCALVCLSGAGLLAAQFPDAVATSRAEAHWDEIDELHEAVYALPWGERGVHYDGLLEGAAKAASLQPGNIKYRYWAAVHAWSRAYDRAVAARLAGEGTPLESSPALVVAATKAHSSLLDARAQAPTFGPLWSVAGQLGVRWLSDPSAVAWIHRGQEFAPHHPATCLASAVQLLEEGREEEAIAGFERAVHMGVSIWEIMDILVKDLGETEVARELAAGHLQRMSYLETLLSRMPGEEERLARLQETVMEMVEEACAGPDPDPGLLLRLAKHRRSEGRDAEAVELYQRVLIRVPDSTCRYQLAAALVRLERLPEARMQLLDLLKIHPEHAAGRRLLETLPER